MSLPSDKVIGARLPSTLRQLGALTCGPWNYAAPHIIRNDTDVRIIEPEYTPVPQRPPPPPQPPPTPPSTHTSDGRTRQRVKQSQFGCKSSSVLHFVIRSVWPGAARISRCKRALQCDYAVALKRSSRDSSDYSAQCCHYLAKFYRDDWLAKNRNLHLWEENIRRCVWIFDDGAQWSLYAHGTILSQCYHYLYNCILTYNNSIYIFKWDIFVNTEYIFTNIVSASDSINRDAPVCETIIVNVAIIYEIN